MTSRIIVKNLPPNLSQPRLKAHFSAQQSGSGAFSGTVTDAKLVTDAKTGRSRGFAFVGYRTQEEALKAVEWFNGTFMDMRKIAVELAKPVLP
jgi:multiple RNA-binding domain-containing protein 1